MKSEIWADIPGYEGLYQVSSFGQVRSLKRGTTSGRVLSVGRGNGGYQHVSLSKNGVTTTRKVHRLVAEVFLPNLDNLPEVNHIDPDKDNNSVRNLEWVTRQQNHDHSIRVGIRAEKGENHVRSVLSDKQVSLIRKIKWDRETAKRLSLKFRVTPGHIRAIRRGVYRTD